MASAEHLAFGAGPVVAPDQYNNVNLWHSNDNGLTLHSIFKAGVTLGAGVGFRHFHSANWNPTDNSLWLATGDGVAAAVDCYWIKGTYNAVSEKLIQQYEKTIQILEDEVALLKSMIR